MNSIKLPSNLSVTEQATIARACASAMYQGEDLNPHLNQDALDILQELQDEMLWAVASSDTMPDRYTQDLTWAINANNAWHNVSIDRTDSYRF